MALVKELPPQCKVIVDKLKNEGFEIRSAYYDTDFNYCVIDFIDPYTKHKIETEPFETGIVPYGWYSSSISYHLDEKGISFNLNKVPKSDFVEITIPEECGESDGACRVHILFDEKIPRVGFESKATIPVPKAIHFILDYFRE